MSHRIEENEGAEQQDVGIAPRRTPVQARSIERVERILDAASELLAEGGYDAVKTNLIAKRAGVSIGSVYQFFPNRFAIFNALADRYRERISATLSTHLTLAPEAKNWERALDSAVAALARLWRGDHAFHSVWLTIQNTPELRDASEDYRNALIDERIAVFLRAIAPHICEERLHVMGRVVLETSNLMLDLSIQASEQESDLMIEELQTLLKSYIRSHLRTGRVSSVASANHGEGAEN